MIVEAPVNIVLLLGISLYRVEQKACRRASC